MKRDAIAYWVGVAIGLASFLALAYGFATHPM